MIFNEHIDPSIGFFPVKERTVQNNNQTPQTLTLW